MDEIVNRVKESGLISMDLADFKPQMVLRGIDISEQLWQGLVLKEKDFRAWVKAHDWSQYTHQAIYVHCSEDAIIPTWAYMLVSAQLQPVAKSIMYGEPCSTVPVFKRK